MPVGLGYKATLGIGEETTYGTTVARAKFLELVNGGDGLARVQPLVRTQSMRSVGVRGDIDVIQGLESVEGNLIFEMPYDGSEKMLKHAFGTVASSQPDGVGDPTVYQHIFTPADTLLTGLSLEIDRDLSAFLYAGCKVNTLELAVDADGLLRLTAGILGQDVTLVAATAPTLPAVGKFNGPQATTLTWNAVAIAARNVRLTLDNNLDAARYKIGSRLRLEPVRQGKLRVTGSLTVEFDSTSVYSDFVNATSRALQIIFVGPAIGVAARTYKLTIDVLIAKLTAYPVTVSNEGRITVDVAFEGFRDATNKELKLTLQNLTASPV